MKKLKGNVILTTFVLSMTLLVLGIFGTDTAYIVLSRFKLQKITEALALEYASSLAPSINNNTNSNQHGIIRNQYQRIYDSKLSGLIALQITGMRYKRILDKNGIITKTVVEVSTTASVLPAFLRFIGTKGIQIHSLAHAKTEKTVYSDSTDIAGGKYYAEFNLNDIMTNKTMGQGDFALNFKYSDNENGGYFVFGSYKVNNRWTDLGYAANSSLQNKIENIGLCINSSNQNPVTFNLSTDNKTTLNGFTKRVNKIRVYKSNGLSKDYFTKAPLNPCTPYNCKDNSPDAPVAPVAPVAPTATAPTPPQKPPFPEVPEGAPKPDCSIHPTGTPPWQYCQNMLAGWEAWYAYRIDYNKYLNDLRQYQRDYSKYLNDLRQYGIDYSTYQKDYEIYKTNLNNCIDYNENRNATVTLTVLNNVRLISKLQYQHPGVSSGGKIISGP